MKLIYLHIEDFPPFRRTELNFVSDFHCSLRAGCRLSVRHRQVLPDHFFSQNGKDELCVSALIGENGSGKTSLVRFLEQLFYPSSKVEFVALVEVRPKILQPFYFFKDRKRRLKIDAQGCGGFEIRPPVRRDYADPDARDEIRECFGVVYYSPHYSPSVVLRSAGEQFADISTTGYLNVAARKAAESASKSKECVSADALYRADELKRILRFTSSLARNKTFPLVSREKDPDPIPIPSGVTVRAASWGRSEVVAGLSFQLNRAKTRLGRKKVAGAWGLSAGERTRLRRMIRLLSQSTMDCFYDIFLCFAAQFWDHSVSWSDRESAKGDYGSALYDLCRRIDRYAPRKRRQAILSFLKRRKPVMAGIVPYRVEGYDHENTPYLFFSMLDKIKHVKRPPSQGEARPSWYYETSGLERVRLVSTMIDVYAASIAYGDYAVVDFDPPMSAGEYSFLVLFARLHDYFEDIRQIVAGYDGSPISASFAAPLKSGWLVILDEAEITLHPSWQRTVVNKLINNFEKIFPGFEVHFIFASHSPILLSDIPIGNVVFLKKTDGNGMVSTCTVATKDFRNTFGANIFDLYRGPYFLTKGTVGKFALKKIDPLVAKINALRSRAGKGPESVLTEDDFRTLDLIGDEIVSRFLWRTCAQVVNRSPERMCHATD